MNKKVFVSYSWDNDAHKTWVLNLAKRLDSKGVEIWIDRFNLKPGTEPTFFMEKAFDADKIIVIMTPGYKLKADARSGGVGHEYSILTHEFYTGNSDRIKIIPILREGNIETSCPRFLRTRTYLDMRDDTKYRQHLQELINAILGENVGANRRQPVPDKPAERASSGSPKSIAILPFVNMSSDPDQEYFSDGVAEEIHNSLSHLSDLRVAGRTSSFQFKGKSPDLREIGKKLNVSTVLEGSVRKSGEQIRVSVKLVNVKDGFNLWSENYNRRMDDIFAIQDDIARSITQKLKLTLLDREVESINQVSTTNSEAYQLYLKGRFFWNRRGPYLKKALQFFESCLAIDPKCAEAHAGIADAYALMGFYAILSPQIAMPKAREAAHRAVAIRKDLPEALTALAFVKAFYDWDWLGAKQDFDRIVQIVPRYSAVRCWRSLYFGWIEGRFEEAIREAKTLVELEPLIGISYYFIII
jgi:TolB-like protein